MKTVHKIIGYFGGVSKFPPLRIKNHPHRPLSIERVGCGSNDRTLVRVGYSPGAAELICEVTPDGSWLPVSYRHKAGGASVEVNAPTADRPADLHLDVGVHLRNFANKWDAILRDHCYFAAAVEQLDTAAVAECA